MMQEILKQLSEADNLRVLPAVKPEGLYIEQAGKSYLNLASNDYLGITCREMHHDFMQDALRGGEFLLSNPSSRLITGNSPDYTSLEQTLSDLYGGKAALVLGSGYLVNSGILPAVTQKGDLVLADKLVHASIIDGLKLCQGEWLRFNHNDMEHLEKLLSRHRDDYRNVWVVTESIFSMDGDCAPLQQLSVLKSKYNFKLYLDEAHAFGVCGPDGRGLAAETGTEYEIIAATLGKAIASQGAFVITDELTRDFLVNRMRTLIFSTALPPISLRWSEQVIRQLPQMDAWRQHLRELSHLLTGTDASTHIVPLIAGENSRAIEMSRKFREAGFWVMPIRYPTVPQGKARVRVSLNAALSRAAIEKFKEVWNSIG